MKERLCTLSKFHFIVWLLLTHRSVHFLHILWIKCKVLSNNELFCCCSCKWLTRWKMTSWRGCPCTTIPLWTSSCWRSSRQFSFTDSLPRVMAGGLDYRPGKGGEWPLWSFQHVLGEGVFGRGRASVAKLVTALSVKDDILSGFSLHIGEVCRNLHFIGHHRQIMCLTPLASWSQMC